MPLHLVQEAVRGAPPPDKKLLEHQFVFACVWAFGGCMLVDKVSDYRTQFSKWWISEYKNVQFPEKVCQMADVSSSTPVYTCDKSLHRHMSLSQSVL